MDDGSLTPGNASDFSIDLDFMDELFLDGCWLETSRPEFIVNSSFRWPDSDQKSGEIPTESANVNTLESSGNLLKSLNHDRLTTDGGELKSGEGLEPNRKIWIGPGGIPLASSSVMERLMAAISNIRQSVSEKNVLVQIWVPENRGGKRVLSAHDDLFALDPSSWKLASYRQVSAKYNFSAEENSQYLAGMPGRVFLGKIPEWTPDVRFFKSDEYPRVDYAHQCEVSGSLALPVFEQGSKNCLGVIELVTTEQKLKYQPELEIVCNALEAVDLRSSEVPRMLDVARNDGSYETVLPEIKSLLEYACKTHGLPLAQTWVPCMQQRKEGSRHSDENYVSCVSTVDSACYVGDPGIQGFHEACSEYHLLKGQGVAGEAFMTNQPCFSSDITLFTKTQYPLSHHAKVFSMCAAVAIRLRSLHSGKADFVLEFFLPVNCRDPDEQKEMLTSLSNVIRRVCQTLRVVTKQELDDEVHYSYNEVLPSEGGPSAETTAMERHQKRVLPTYQSDYLEEQCSRKPREENNMDPKRGEPSSSFSMKGERRRNKAEKLVSLDVIRPYFAGSLKDAAKSIGVCPTTLKRICRRHGIQRWPSRKIKKVGHSLQKIQDVIDSVQGASHAVKISSFCKDFNVIGSHDAFIPSSNATSDHPPHPRQQPEGETSSFKFGVPRSPLSPSSQDNSSSQSCSGGSQSPYSVMNPSEYVASGLEDVTGAETPKRAESYPELRSQGHDRTIQSFGIKGSTVPGYFRRVGSNWELQRDQGAIVGMPISRNQLSIMDLPNPGNKGTLFPSVEGDDDSYRVKVEYEGEKVRFRMPKSWGFHELRKEVSDRFSISDSSRIDMKYLDDDTEWVLLTCNADLKECILISQTTESRTIRLMLDDSSARGRRQKALVMPERDII